MADDDKKPQPNPDAKPEIKPEIKPGTAVHLVLASGKHAPAKVTKVRKGNLVDLEAEHLGEPLVITSAPLDESGQRHDSWHLPETQD